MKIKFNKKASIDAFKLAYTAVGKSPPIMECFLIGCDKSGVITVTAGDTATEISSIMSGAPSCDSVGSFVIDAKKTMKALATMSGDITITAADDKAKIKSGKSTLKVATFSVTDYPRLKGIDCQPTEFTALKAIQTVAHASAIDDVRFYLNGVLISVYGDIVATNGHRLAHHKTDMRLPNDVIIPAAAVQIINKVFGKSDSELHVKADKKSIEIYDEYTTITAQLLDGKYPNWERVVFKGDIDINADVDELLSAIDIASVGDDNGIGAGMFSAKDGVISVEAGDSNSTGHGELNCDCEDFEIGINLPYLSQSIKSCTGDVTISVKKDKGITVASGDYLEIIMAMRI